MSYHQAVETGGSDGCEARFLPSGWEPCCQGSPSHRSDKTDWDGSPRVESNTL